MYHPDIYPVGSRVALQYTGAPDLDGHVGIVVGFYGGSISGAYEQFYIILYDVLELCGTHAGVWIHGCLKPLNERDAGATYVCLAC